MLFSGFAQPKRLEAKDQKRLEAKDEKIQSSRGMNWALTMGAPLDCDIDLVIA